MQGKDLHWGIPLHAGLWGRGKFIKRLATVRRTLCKGRMCIEEYHRMQSFGGGKFRKWLGILIRTLCKGRMRIQKYHCMQSFSGGKFRKWLAILTRTLWKGRMCIEEYHCMQSFGGGEVYKNDLQPWEELYAREGCALRTTIACRALGGGKFRKWLAIVTRTLWKGRMCIEDYHCMQSFGGGKFRKWLAIVTRTLWKGRMCIEEYHCMQSFWGGSLENDLQSWQELCEREGMHWWLLLHAHVGLWGGKFIKRLATVRRTLCKGRMCIEEYHCMQSFGGGSLENDLESW